MLVRMAVRKSTGRSGRYFIGVGGWNFAEWRGVFYPRGLPHARELAFMSRELSSIEINSTFYGLQKPATFRRWHNETPEDFVFAVKAPRFVVGRRDLATAADSIDRFLDSGVLRLEEKLGPINWQLPPTKRFVASEIDAFLSLLPSEREGRSLQHAIEVRHASFAVPQFVQLARRHSVAVVLAGDAQYPQIADPTAAFAYLRIMGTLDEHKNGYAPAALSRWAQRAQALAKGDQPKSLDFVAEPAVKAQPRDVYLYVISGAKRRNPAAAQALLRKIENSEAGASRRPLA
jgi:uncharacterized protein YecE (DUF72 family)